MKESRLFKIVYYILENGRITAPELAEKFDILLAVDSIVFEQMEAIAPDEEAKMHTYIGFSEGMDGEQTDEKYAVIDPFDDDIDRYRESAQQMKEAAERIVSRIEREYID